MRTHTVTYIPHTLTLPHTTHTHTVTHHTHAQGQKLSRYSRQAKELVENGGYGLGEEELLPEYMLQVKRPRLQTGDVTANITMEIGHAEMV